MTTATRPDEQATLPGIASKFKPSIPIRARYDNWIGGEYRPPERGQYFTNPSPVTGQPLCEVARSTQEDIDKALDAAHAAAVSWNTTSATYRAIILNKIADRLEENLETMAFIETMDNGKPIRETTHADLPLAIDHFRYFAGAIRAQEGGISELDHDTIAYHFHEPLGVVGQIIPWNFPLLMAVWKLAPALAAGNCVVLKPAEQTPVSIMAFMELVADIVQIFENYDFECEVLAASLRHPMHVGEAAKMGAHIGTMPMSVFTSLLKHPLTDIGLARFLADWEKAKKEMGARAR